MTVITMVSKWLSAVNGDCTLGCLCKEYYANRLVMLDRLRGKQKSVTNHETDRDMYGVIAVND